MRTFGLCSGICLIPLAVCIFMGHISEREMQGFHGVAEDKKRCDVSEKPSLVLDGLKYLLKSLYFRYFIVVSFYEILITLIDFQF